MLAIVGMPCSGKSTIGKRLANRLHRPFIDLDAAIETRLGCSIRQFFAQHGEEKFRDIESDMVEKMSRINRCVLSTGGGTVLRKQNREILKQRGTVLYLYATPEQLLPRIGNKQTRPLLQAINPLERLATLYHSRDDLYRDTAHHVIATVGSTPSEIVLAIFERLDMYKVPKPNTNELETLTLTQFPYTSKVRNSGS